MAAPFLLTTSAGCAFAGLPSLRGHTSRGRALRRKTCTLPVNRAEERLFAKEVGDFPPPTPAWPARASGVQSCGSRPMGSTCGGHRLSLTLPRLVVLSTSQSMWLLDAAWSVGCRVLCGPVGMQELRRRPCGCCRTTFAPPPWPSVQVR